MPLMKNDETFSLGFLIHDAARLMRRRFEARVSEHGLSAAQWRLLVQLKKGEGIAQARLAALLEIEPISVSRLLDRMEEGGWIERRPDTTDRRVRNVYPTDRTRQIFNSIRAMAGEIYAEALAGLSQQQQQAVLEGLLRINENLAEADRASTAQTTENLDA
jgi:DNA-binding MarR family transcriptional regulator